MPHMSSGTPALDLSPAVSGQGPAGTPIMTRGASAGQSSVSALSMLASDMPGHGTVAGTPEPQRLDELDVAMRLADHALDIR